MSAILMAKLADYDRRCLVCTPPPLHTEDDTVAKFHYHHQARIYWQRAWHFLRLVGQLLATMTQLANNEHI